MVRTYGTCIIELMLAPEVFVEHEQQHHLPQRLLHFVLIKLAQLLARVLHCLNRLIGFDVLNEFLHSEPELKLTLQG